MTREEAIAFGKRVIDLGFKGETQTFCELAIKALEQQPCEDCISRENLLKAFKDECRGECDNCPHFRKVDGEYKCRLIADFPSVTPKKTETWNGIHTQITAPKDTLEQIFNDADDDNDI